MDGLPIGNYYSQLIMNLCLEKIIEFILEYDPTEFVDDFLAFLEIAKDFKELVRKMNKAADSIGLKLNFKKIHIQPVRHGVLWCGHFIYPNRMYASNRVIGNCLWQIDYVYSEVNLSNARRLVQTLNSYSGFLCHCNEWNTQKRIFDKVMSTEYRQYIEAHFKQNHIIYDMRSQYRRKQMSLNDISELDNMFNRKYKEAV